MVERFLGLPIFTISCQTSPMRNLTATIYLTYFEYYLSDFSYEKPINQMRRVVGRLC
jgi:hypothetical protein